MKLQASGERGVGAALMQAIMAHGLIRDDDVRVDPAHSAKAEPPPSDRPPHDATAAPDAEAEAWVALLAPAPITLTAFQGRAGDRNDLAAPGARAVAEALAQRLDLPAHVVGQRETALNRDWDIELAAAAPALEALSARLSCVLERGGVPLTVMPRCAAALATLPVVARLRPDALVVWLDAHADANTPETSLTGYLGGMVLSGVAGRWDSGLGQGLDLANVVLVGARDIDPSEQAMIDAGELRLVLADEDLPRALKAVIGRRPVYVHLDCDVLSPGLVPTEYQVKGGLSLNALRAAAEVLASCEITGLEVAEFQEAWAEDGPPVSPARLLDALSPLLAAMGRQRLALYRAGP